VNFYLIAIDSYLTVNDNIFAFIYRKNVKYLKNNN